VFRHKRGESGATEGGEKKKTESGERWKNGGEWKNERCLKKKKIRALQWGWGIRQLWKGFNGQIEGHWTKGSKKSVLAVLPERINRLALAGGFRRKTVET